MSNRLASLLDQADDLRTRMKEEGVRFGPKEPCSNCGSLEYNIRYYNIPDVGQNRCDKCKTK